MGSCLHPLFVAKLLSLRRQSPLQQAMQELSRLPKTGHILSYVDGPVLRRRVLVGLKKQDGFTPWPGPFASGGREG
jgi:TnpA family transposase